MNTTLQLARFNNNRDIDYADIDREFAAIYPVSAPTYNSVEIFDVESLQGTMVANKSEVGRSSPSRHRDRKKFRVLLTIVLVGILVAAVMAVLINPVVNDAFNAFLSRLGIFTNISLIDISTFLTSEEVINIEDSSENIVGLSSVL